MNRKHKKPSQTKCFWVRLYMSVLLSMTMLLPAVSVSSLCAFAAEMEDTEPATVEMEDAEPAAAEMEGSIGDITANSHGNDDIYVNPLYDDVYSAADVSNDLTAAGLYVENEHSDSNAVKPHNDYNIVDGSSDDHVAGSQEIKGETMQAAGVAAVSQEAVTWEKAVVLTRQAQVEKQEDIILFVQGQRTREDARQLWLEAQTHTGVPEEGDYLHYDFKGVRLLTRYEEAAERTRLEFQAVYYTTPAQEDVLKQKIGEALDSLHLNVYSDYGVVREIYQYICSHVSYDNGHKDDRDYTLKYTAYAALIDGTAVCQGFASLFYRMCLERGIDARVIPGTSGGEGHAWNIVRMGDYYYNGDTTWDAGKQQAQWNYFLVSNTHLYGHSRRSSYNTDDFNLAYPMGENDYVPSAADLQLYFTDVTDAASYYYTPVEWASSVGITSGMTDGSFGVGKTCTRAQIVTFLYHGWLLAGGEELGWAEADVILSGRFTDVPEESFWYLPAAWAVKYGITVGTAEGSFSPYAPCTRSQMVTFLYRAALAARTTDMQEDDSRQAETTDIQEDDSGKAVGTDMQEDDSRQAVGTDMQEDATGQAEEQLAAEQASIAEATIKTITTATTAEEESLQFTDVPSDAYYYQAVRWALDQGVTAGTGDGTTFRPGQSVTREQAATMLYKAMKATAAAS